MQAVGVQVAPDPGQIDVQHANRLGAVDGRYQPPLAGEVAKPLHGIQVSAAGNVAEEEHFRAFVDRPGNTFHDIVFTDEWAGDMDFFDLDSVPFRPDPPGPHRAGMLLGRHEDPVARLQVQPVDNVIKPLGRVARQGDFSGFRAKKTPHGRPEFVFDVVVKDPLGLRGILRHQTKSRGDGVAHRSGRHADGGVVEVGVARFEDELSADPGPVCMIAGVYLSGLRRGDGSKHVRASIPVPGLICLVASVFLSRG